MFYVLTHAYTHTYLICIKSELAESYKNIFFYDTFILSSFGHHTIRFPFVLHETASIYKGRREHEVDGTRYIHIYTHHIFV